MRCPKCKAEYSKPRVVSKEDKINEFGRRQITITSEQDDYISWDAKTETFSCAKCGHVFSFLEGVMQK